MIPADRPAAIGSARHAHRAHRARSAAVALLLAAAATLALLAHHPVANGHPGGPPPLDALVRLGGAAALVHGALIGIVGVLFYAVLSLAQTLGLRRPAAAFGIAAYGFGCALMIEAMLLDGFVTAPLAQRLLQEQMRMQGGGATLALVASGIQVLTRTGFCAMGLGVCCLSWARPRAAPFLAWLALPATLLPASVVAAGGIALRPHSLIVLAALQGLWYAGAAVYLWRGIAGGGADHDRQFSR